jgi:NAD(P)-dependent dehydrogenase (short-subunit alcohol dehydrogenase family)
LAEAGANVVIGDIEAERAQAAAAEDLASRFSGRVIGTRMDVADTASIAATVELVREKWGGLHVWVNNAGVFPNVPLLDMTDESSGTRYSR